VLAGQVPFAIVPCEAWLTAAGLNIGTG
jgi:hypothetical protein